ncbi:WD40-repeat-containing domain protein [Pterulicium gracile]|uniref:WD repeat-containing protein JIP5 n=1 Tax=Pterulicium gracile TaxID=1884261 RepID=A0A5C3QTM4_9AGAR|nr:WD40-repeat-containing domain protein [Pterula gracilis]
MPNIQTGGQVFDLAFHPTHETVYTALLTGEVKAFQYDEQGNSTLSFEAKPSKKSCRGLSLTRDGAKLWSVGKGKAIHAIDTTTGGIVESKTAAHEVPINRVKYLMPWMFATGDDDGVIKLWDPRQSECIRSHNHHFDFISDFLYLEDKKHLISSSADGTLSVLDVRSKKAEPYAQSEDQEDELLSLLPIKGGAKVVVGTQQGVLSIFNRKKGWGDCVDRVPGHPTSIDALCSIPSSYPSSINTILTGSSDGLLRVVEVLPSKLVGVIADHGDFPIERIAVDKGGEGRWVGSAGHEELLKLTDLKEVFEDESADEDEGAQSLANADSDSDDGDDSDAKSSSSTMDKNTSKPTAEASKVEAEEDDGDSSAEEDSDAEAEAPKRKRKQEKDPFSRKKKKDRNEVTVATGFFSDL